MADVTGRIGDNEVELNNAATEATLKALLLASAGSVKEMKKLAKLAEKAGMDARAIQDAETAVELLGKNSSLGAGSLGKLNPLLGALGKGATFLGGVVGDLAASAFKTAGNLTSLTGSLVDGAGAASDLAGAFRDLPLGLGLVASAFQKLLQLQEAELETYRQLTKSGINLGGSLTTVRLEALSLGLTLDQFGSVLTNNSVALASMGTNAEDGAKNFVKLAKDLRNSPMGEQLRALGFTAEQSADGLAKYIQMTGGRTADEMRNTKGLSESAGQYMKQLDMLATLTGRSREEQEKALQEAQQNAAFEAYLQTLDEDGRKKAMAGLAQAMAIGGKDAVQLLQSRLMNIPPVTEGAQMLAAALPNAANGIYGIADAVKDSSKTMSDVNKASAQAMAGTQIDMKKYSKEMLASMSMVGGPGAQTLLTAQSNLNRAYKQGLVTQQDFEKAMNNITEAQDRAKTSAAAAAETEKNMRDMGASTYAALIPVIQLLTKYGNELVEKFSTLVKTSMPDIEKGAKKLADWLSLAFTEAGRKQMLEDMKDWLRDLFKGLFEIIKSAVVGPQVTIQNQQSYEQQNEKNKSIMTGGERVSTFIAEGLEGFLGFFSEEYAKRIAADRIRRDTEAGMASGRLPSNTVMPGTIVPPVSRATGSLGETGSLFENFGKKTSAELHGVEAVVTPQQMSDLLVDAMQKGQNNILIDELRMLNKQTAEMLAYVRDTADTGRRSIDALRGLSGNLYPV